MARLVLFLLAVAAAAAGLHWLADRPGTLALEWQGYAVETSVFRAVVILALTVAAAVMVWSIIRQLWQSPAAVGQLIVRRREARGLQALSSGMIAIGSGDRAAATRSAIQARKSLPNEPLTHLLRAQAAQLQGDGATARRIFESMLASPDTEQLGLRGLYLEADRLGEHEAARQFAERAMRLNAKSEWPVDALFDLQCKAADWDGALETLGAAKRNGLVDKAVADRRRAVLLTAQAQSGEEHQSEKALALAVEAHNLAPDLVPAAAIAGRLLASRGQTPKAAKIIQRAWKASPHPDLALVYAHARTGDSISDRLDRLRQLASLDSDGVEGPIALATAAIEARQWDVAREALTPLIENRLTQRVATLMARLEGEQHGATGKVREWLARAVNAPRDPVWTADGIVSHTWVPVSPVSGQLDAFQWRVPVETVGAPEGLLLKAKLEEFVQLGAGDGHRQPHGVIAADAPPASATHHLETPRPAARPARPDVEDAVEVTIRTAPAMAPAKPVIIAVPVTETDRARLSPQDFVIDDTATASLGLPKDREKKTSEPRLVSAPHPSEFDVVEPADQLREQRAASDRQRANATKR